MSLLYKEYLDEDEAAEYMVLGKNKFNEVKESLGVHVYRLPGVAKNVYKRDELKSIMERQLEWRPSIKGAEDGISSGPILQASIDLASRNTELRRKRRQKTTDMQRNSN